MSGEPVLSVLRRRITHGPTIAEAFGRGVAEGNNFDAIRLFAALMVLYAHSFLLTIEHDPTDILDRMSGGQTGYGDIAIGTFFVLSGFLIAASWMRRPDIAVFARNRVMRIMPALTAVVLASIFLIGPAVTTLSASEYFADNKTWRYLLNLVFLYTNNRLPGVFTEIPHGDVVNGPLWTLTFEVICYGLLALIGAARKLTPCGCLAVIIACMALSIVIGDTVDSPTENFLRRLSVMGAWFFGGAFLAVAGNRIPLNSGIALLSVAALALSMRVGGFAQIFVFAGPYLVLFAGLSWRGPLRHVSRVGDFSYGVYIWSWPVQQIALLHVSSNSPAAVLAISFPLSLALAFISWRYIEKPALRLKSKSALASLYRQPVRAGSGP
jgi:peptidoglycan/LPS O-acetylase OafA/YrhL